MNYLIVLVGPTGIGKTEIGIQLARHFNTEIISSDSRQIFKELSIGTAIPDSQQLNTVKHHFVQNRSIFETYNASQFEHDVLTLLDQVFQQKNIVLMVGGSMMYVDAVCKGIDIMPDVDPTIRENVNSMYKTHGLGFILEKLKTIDPYYYNMVDKKNPIRTIHALEVFLTTGTPYSQFRTNKAKERPFQTIKIGLNTDREKLYDNINNRVDAMIANGLIEEARGLYPHRQLTPLNTVGYKELFLWMDGTITLDNAIEQIKSNTRNYARKQLTWFRKDAEIKWFEPSNYNEIISFVIESLSLSQNRGDKDLSKTSE